MFGDHVRGVRLAASAAVAALVASSGIAGVAQAQVVEPVVSVGTAMVMETFARGDWVQAVVPVTLDRPAAADVTVSYATADGTAQAGSQERDYEPATGSLTIPAGAVEASIQVLVLGDSQSEQDETATVALSEPLGATLGAAEGTVVIRDRASAGLVVSDVRLVETDDAGAAKVVATVAQSERQPGDVSVAWATQELGAWPPGGAYEGPDYLSRSGTAVIPAGRLDTRIQLWVRGDVTPEGREVFQVVLDPASTAATIADGVGEVSILDRDEPRLPATERVDVRSDGSQVQPIAFGQLAISEDGRFVAFFSGARDQVPGDTNLSDDVFWHDNLTGVTRRVSVATSGREGNFSSRNPDISADGRFVVFESFASRLVPGDTNGRDIFVHDVAAGTTSLVSVRSDGTQGTGDTGNPGISGDGRFVVFESSASDLVPGDTNGQSDIFLHDMVSGATTRVSLSSAGAQGTGGGSQFPVISADGGVVAFASDATDLVPGDTNDSTDLFARELATGVTRRVSVSSSGEQNQGPELSVPALSADGTMVAFSSAAGNLVPGDTNLINDVFVHDTAAGTTTRVTQRVDGSQTGIFSIDPDISDDGRLVAFPSEDDQLVPGDTNGDLDVFVHDRSTGITRRVSVTTGGSQVNPGGSNWATLSGDGRYVAFGSNSGGLVPGDTNSAFSVDIFVRGPLE